MRREILFFFALLTLLQVSKEEEETCAENIVEKVRKQLKDLADTKQIHVEGDPYEIPNIPNGIEEYDMIVVGSGSAGSILTNRLSEVTGWKVLLLEAGGEPDLLTDVPMLLQLQQFTEYNWGYVTEKEDRFALGLENQRMHWPRGKGLGGTSLLNYMVYSRGNRIDYDRWAEMGNEGWSYEQLLPFFKKLENCKIKIQDEAYRNKGGELSVEDSSYRTKLADAFVEGAREIGYDYVDYNGQRQTGVSYIQATTRKGLRCSGERGFIRPAKNRKNLTIRFNSQATKILIDKKTNKAYGVEYKYKGGTYMAKASKEIVLSAGVINSAHILMLSGVGPQKDLERLGIEVIHDLPVGKKIYDHPAYWGLVFTANQSVGYDFEKMVDSKSFIKLFNEGRGPLHNLGGIETIAFTKTNASTDQEDDFPDIEFLLMSRFHPSDKGVIFRKMLRITDKIYNTLYKPLEGKTAFGIVIMLMRPVSYGHMGLQSKDPMIYPRLYGGYFTDPEGHDVKTMIAGVREAVRIAKSPAMQKYGVEVVETPIPGCEAHQYDTDAYWECALRHLTSTIYHHTTTCKMGPAADQESVVDDRLRVHGIRNLRVADTSIIPLQLTAHTNVPAYLVGEKAAAIIKDDWL